MVQVGFAFLLNFFVTFALWWAARHLEAKRRAFWRLWAFGWALNLLGNVVWSIYDVVTQQALAIFTWVDAFYLARYAVLLWSCWRYPRPWRGRQWAIWSAATAIGVAAVWGLLYRPAAVGPLYFLGGALYPMLDVSLLTALILSQPRWSGGMRTALTLLAAGAFVYGVANWMNFGSRVIDLAAYSFWAEVFWLLSDVLTVGAVILTGQDASGETKRAVTETEVGA
jgi:hypothetical protein